MTAKTLSTRKGMELGSGPGLDSLVLSYDCNARKDFFATKYIYYLLQEFSMPVSLRSFHPIEPKFILSHAWGEWVLLILFCGLFIALASAILPKRLTEGNAGKAICIILGIMMGIGLFMMRSLYHFNLESFGMLAVGLIIILAVFVTYGLTKFGMSKTTAVALTYCLVFLTFVMPEPSIFDAFAETLPILNLLFYVAFIIMAGKLFIGMFGGFAWSAGDAAKDLKRMSLDEKGLAGNDPEKARETQEVEKDIKDDEREDKAIQYKTFEVTRKELKTIDDIYLHLKEITDTIQKKGNSLQESDKAGMLAALRTIQKDEYILLGGLIAIRNHAKAYKLKHKRDITEIEDRLKKTRSPKQKKILSEELTYQNKMIEAIEYLDKYEARVFEFKKAFDRLLYMAVERLKAKNAGEAIAYIKSAQLEIAKIRFIYEKQMQLEHYIVKINKKTIDSLKEEKKAVQG